MTFVWQLNPSQRSPLLGVTLLFQMVVLRCHTVLSCVYMMKFQWKRLVAKTDWFSLFFCMYSYNNRLLKLVRTHFQRFSNKTSRWRSQRNTQRSEFSSEFNSDFSNFEREEKVFSKGLSYFHEIWPWLILMDKRHFLSEPRLICHWMR